MRASEGIEVIRFPLLASIGGCLVHSLFLGQALRGPVGEAGEGSFLAPISSVGYVDPPLISLRESVLEVVLGLEAGCCVQWNPRTLWG